MFSVQTFSSRSLYTKGNEQMCTYCCNNGAIKSNFSENTEFNHITVLESWLNTCTTCIRWNGRVLHCFSLAAGVRQGVLSPLLFVTFIDTIVDWVKTLNVGCYINTIFCSIFLRWWHTVPCSYNLRFTGIIIIIHYKSAHSTTTMIYIYIYIYIRWRPRLAHWHVHWS